MKLLQLLLISIILILGIYTGLVGVNHGWNLIPIFFDNIQEVTWSGQFNLDFMFFLLLSALWTAWRNNFTPKAYALSITAFFFGIMFLAPYLLWLIHQSKGDLKVMLIGNK